MMQQCDILFLLFTCFMAPGIKTKLWTLKHFHYLLSLEECVLGR